MEPKLQSVPVWIKASEPPKENDLYHVRIRMTDTDEETFPAAINFTRGEWEMPSDGYEVIEWLDEQKQAYVLTEKEFQDYTERVALLKEAARIIACFRTDAPKGDDRVTKDSAENWLLKFKKI